MIRIGIIAAPRIIAARIQLWQQNLGYDFHFYVIGSENQLENFQNITYCKSISTLIEQSDCVDLAEQNEATFGIFTQLVRVHKSVFLDNPFAWDLPILRQCAQLVKESGIICQPGLYLRFQEDIIDNSQYNFRFLDTGVSLTATSNVCHYNWLSLVNNHVDLLSYLADTPIKKIAAFSMTINEVENALLNFRIQFDNSAVGTCTINTNALVAEQVSLLYNENQQKLIVWSKNNAVSDAIFDKNCVIDAMGAFLNSFVKQIGTKVTIFDALNSVELTKDILNQIEV